MKKSNTSDMREQFDEIDNEFAVLCPDVDTEDDEHEDSLEEYTPEELVLVTTMLCCWCCCLLRMVVTEGYGVNVNGGDAM